LVKDISWIGQIKNASGSTTTYGLFADSSCETPIGNTISISGTTYTSKKIEINGVDLLPLSTSGKYLLETWAGISTDVEIASEYRYRDPVIQKNTAVIAISQSGETADTLAALREGKMKGALPLGIVNVVGSTIARETKAGIYTHAGPELGVASTKAFISQCTTLAMLSVLLGRSRTLSHARGTEIITALEALPTQVSTIIEQRDSIIEIAKKYATATNMLFLGRTFHAPIAYEGALKVKEVSYIHAEGYPAGEIKHGPLALVDENLPCVVLCPKDSVFQKTLSNIQEIHGLCELYCLFAVCLFPFFQNIFCPFKHIFFAF
jgi:glucosamine--fructose-6-phosphate aminotransferase (isomerizing)